MTFIYFYNGAGEPIATLDKDATAQRREFARDIIEARGDSVPNCSDTGFSDASCADNPNDGKYIERFVDVGITAGCGAGDFCPNQPTTREQAAVFFVKGMYCPLNGTGCSYMPSDPCEAKFDDVPCTSPFAVWIEKLYADGITGGCSTSPLLYCPAQNLKVWEMMAWLQNVDHNPIALPDWRGYNPVPRAAVVTFRDGAQLTTEARFPPPLAPSGDTSAVFNYIRDDHYLGRQLIAATLWLAPPTPGWHFYSSDHLGTPRLVTSPAGTEVEERKFWPYGDPGPFTGTDSSQRLKFALMERDSESTHYYDHARYQGFTTGRFLAPDPLFGGSSDPQSWNRYSYVLGSPITMIDPTGLMTCEYDGEGNLIGCHDDITVTGSRWYVPWFPSYGGGRPPSGGGGGGWFGGGVGVESGGGGWFDTKPSAENPCAMPAGPSRADVESNVADAGAHRLFGPIPWFYNQVRNHGPWDYKQDGEQYRDFGNWHDAVTGTAAGYPPSILRRGAGWAQERAGTSLPEWGHWWTDSPHGDDPNDQKWINRGIFHYENCR